VGTKQREALRGRIYKNIQSIIKKGIGLTALNILDLYHIIFMSALILFFFLESEFVTSSHRLIYHNCCILYYFVPITLFNAKFKAIRIT